MFFGIVREQENEIAALKDELTRLRTLVDALAADLLWCRDTAWSDNEGCFVKDVYERLAAMYEAATAAGEE